MTRGDFPLKDEIVTVGVPSRESVAFPKAMFVGNRVPNKKNNGISVSIIFIVFYKPQL